MTLRHTLSIIVESRWGGHHLPRVLQSLAWQSSGLERLEIVHLDDGSSERATRQARIWAGMLPGTFVSVPVASGACNHECAIRAVNAASGDLVLHPHASARFLPAFLESVLHHFDAHRGTDVLYTNFVDLGEAAAGLVRLPRFARWRLRGRNIIGPQAVFRREGMQSLPGPRPQALFPAWDLGVQAALAGFSFQRLDNALFSCGLERPDPARAQQGAAMIVVNNPGFFADDVVRWALAATRRTPWALEADPFRIPIGREVRHLHAEFVRQENEGTARWLWALAGRPSVLPPASPAKEQGRMAELVPAGAGAVI
ncbi:MAG: hypothetical protein AB7D51_08705 [Desulfovibrionaceae bacterium]